MVESRVIRPSQSSYSSLVILEIKKDEAKLHCNLPKTKWGDHSEYLSGTPDKRFFTLSFECGYIGHPGFYVQVLADLHEGGQYK